MATSIQIGIFMVFLSCVIYEAGAIFCYKCTSHYHDYCTDDFDKSLAGVPTDCTKWAEKEKLDETPDACVKIVQKVHRIVKGNWFKPEVVSNITTRTCGYKKTGGTGCSHLLGSQAFGALCYCSTDKCNAAGSTQSTFTLLLSSVAVSFVVLKLLHV